jgi:hypothetical protein
MRLPLAQAHADWRQLESRVAQGRVGRMRVRGATQCSCGVGTLPLEIPGDDGVAYSTGCGSMG